jgi:primosomal protein N' (replication factor Y)
VSLSAGVTAEQRVPRAARYAQIIVDVEPFHLDRPFDYAVPDDVVVAFGQQVAVSFAGRRRTGWVVGLRDWSEAEPSRIKALAAVRGALPRFERDDLRLYRWVAARWGGTLASVLRHALPKRVAAVDKTIDGWGPPPERTVAGHPPCPGNAWRHYQGSALLRATAAVTSATVSGRPDDLGREERGAAAGLGSVSGRSHDGPAPAAPAFWWRPLPGEDMAAMIGDLVLRCLAAGRDALVLVPDPASDIPDVVLQMAGDAGADLRSARSDRVRYRAFLRGRTGHARVIVGERGAVFAPLGRLGLIVVDDEANPAYKERRSPRHHARDVALARGRLAGATTVVTGALPSAALWRLLERGDVTAVEPTRPDIRAHAPRVDVVDPGQHSTVRSRLSAAANDAVRAAVVARGVAVMLVARRGDGTALACRRCGTSVTCPVCDSAVGPDGAGRRRCPTCGWGGPATVCASCGGDVFVPLAAGTNRWATELARAHPDAQVVVMEGFDAVGPTRRPAIAVMTRGSVVRRPTWLGDEHARVLVLPDADALLARPRYDAAEDLLRLCLAATWTDRMIVQTRQPGDPAVQALVRWDPTGFWRGEARRRAQLGYPPARVLIYVDTPAQLATDVAKLIEAALPAGDELTGPDLEGRLAVKSADPRGTLSALDPLRQRWSREDVRVGVDVDPVPALDRRY